MASIKIKKILVPVDFSGTGEKVMRQAAAMSRLTRAEIVLLNVLEGPLAGTGSGYFGGSAASGAKYEKEMTGWIKDELDDLRRQLIGAGVTKISYLIEKGTPYKKILAAAKKVSADVIIMGTHGVSGVREFVIGSNTFRVVSEATCPVLSVQKRTTKEGFREILLPFCDKPHSRESVDYAIKMAELYHAKLHILGICYDTTPAARKKIEIEAKQIEKAANHAHVKNKVEIIKGNYFAKLIFDHAIKCKADLIVITSDLDRLSISDVIIGPVAQQIVNHSYIPVLSIHPTYNPKFESVSSWQFWG